MNDEFVDAEVWPEGSLEVLSRLEADQLKSGGTGGLYPLLRRCMLAVLNADSNNDDAAELMRVYKDFKIGFIQQDRGLKVLLKNAPPEAFVDGTMIRGTRELLFAVLRDIVFTRNEVLDSGRFDLDASDGVTNAVFHIVRNARLLTLPAGIAIMNGIDVSGGFIPEPGQQLIMELTDPDQLKDPFLLSNQDTAAVEDEHSRTSGLPFWLGVFTMTAALLAVIRIGMLIQQGLQRSVGSTKG